MDKDLLYDLYFIKKKSFRDIGEIIGRNNNYVRRYMIKYGFKSRTLSEAGKLRCIDKPQSNPGRPDMPRKYHYGKNNVLYKGGYIRKTGYKIIYDKGIQYLEHRKVWIDHYGEIPPGYHIHHINGDKLDNRIENLQLLTNSEHQIIHKRLKLV